MKRLPLIVFTLAWSLWIGGMIALFIFVQSLFARSRPLALDAAPVLFVTFERYQLILGAVALASGVIWRLTARNRLATLILILLVLAALGAIVSSVTITAPMETLRAAGRTDTPQFRQLHGYSMMVYTLQAGLLLIAGLLLPSACAATGRPAPPQTAAETPPA